jgi:hypothetical protein
MAQQPHLILFRVVNQYKAILNGGGLSGETVTIRGDYTDLALFRVRKTWAVRSILAVTDGGCPIINPATGQSVGGSGIAVFGNRNRFT